MTTPNNTPQPGGNADKIASDQAVLEVLRKTRASMLRVRDKLSEPLAIVGVGCRFPQASGPSEFWKLLDQGRCAISETPATRWSAALKASEAKQKGKITANQGGYLQDVDQFDAAFFGISGREAAAVDPQQRLLLEVAWETLEHAGIDPHGTRGSRTGVFTGICSHDYLDRLSKAGHGSISNYHGVGNAHGAAAGRINYFMNWSGPSVAVDTACSSSLTALHLAARSIRYGDCEMALVAGVNLILSPDLSISLSQAGMLSPTGLCHTFDAAADGFVRGEGCGAVLLKRLSAAVAANDRILCVVRGTACNQDGRSNGLTAPNGLSQEEVVRAALADARANPGDIDYIEAHGTGTSLGDPIEMAALQSVFARGRSADRPLRTGSVKTNIGHLEGAAGIAGVIKVALSLHHGHLPSHLHFTQPSPHIDWNWPVQTTGQPEPWARSNRPRLAGVSSFGFGGSNAHVVLEEAPVASSPSQFMVAAANDSTQLLVVPARCEKAARELAADYAEALREGVDVASLCCTAATGRAQFDHRIAVTGSSAVEIANKLEEATPRQAAGVTGAMLLECGPSMSVSCDAIYQRFEVFRDAFDNAVEALDAVARTATGAGVDSDRLRAGAGLNEQETRLQQFARLYALGLMWREFGAGKVTAGRGAEHAGAAVAGLLSLQQAADLFSHQVLVEQAADETRDDAMRRFSAVLSQIAFQPNHHYQVRSPRDVSPTSGDYWTSVLQSACDRGVGVADGPQCDGQCDKNVSLHVSTSDTLQHILEQLGGLYRNGMSINWRAVFSQRLLPSAAPVYRFQRKRHWIDISDAAEETTFAPPVADSPAAADESDPVHPLLGWQLDLAGACKVFETDLAKLGYLQDHRVGGRVLFPATGYLELAAAAAHEMRDGLSVTQLEIQRPVVVAEDKPTRVQVAVREEGGDFHCEISVRTSRVWKTAAQCVLKVVAPVNAQQRMAANRNGHSSPVAVDHHYRQCQAVGLDYGAAFQGVEELFGAKGEAWGVVRLPGGIDSHGYIFHPAALDACLQVGAAAISQHATQGWVPVSIGHYEIHREIHRAGAPGDLQVYVRTDAATTAEELSLSFVIHDTNGNLVAAIDQLKLAALTGRQDGQQASAPASSIEVTPVENPVDAGPAAIDTNDQVAAILAADPQQRGGMLQSYLHGRVADIMGMTREEIPAQTPLDSLGMDSMMAFELRDELERDFNLMVPMELFLQETSLEQFSQNVAHGLEKLEGLSSSDTGMKHSEPDDDESWIEGAI